mmetsp:Transcript_80385/g.245715  ORF Transcript_80385/g.245715 Transcript_80385/m.245715 type:complete len:244 (-) Transcript_80385:1729-2460(-)
MRSARNQPRHGKLPSPKTTTRTRCRSSRACTCCGRLSGQRHFGTACKRRSHSWLRGPRRKQRKRPGWRSARNRSGNCYSWEHLAARTVQVGSARKCPAPPSCTCRLGTYRKLRSRAPRSVRRHRWGKRLRLSPRPLRGPWGRPCRSSVPTLGPRSSPRSSSSTRWVVRRRNRPPSCRAGMCQCCRTHPKTPPLDTRTSPSPRRASRASPIRCRPSRSCRRRTRRGGSKRVTHLLQGTPRRRGG